MGKKEDLPAMPFYFGDWRKAPEIRALDLDVRMVWFEMLGLMWESTERGYLTLNGKPVTDFVITKMIGTDITTVQRALNQLEEFNVFSRREDGAIFCRRMVKDEQLRTERSRAGKEGMKSRYSKNSENDTPFVTDFVITKQVTNHITTSESENENEGKEYKGVQGEEKQTGGEFGTSVVMYDADAIIEQFTNSYTWKHNIMTSTYAKGMHEKQLDLYMRQFVEELRDKGELTKSLQEYRRHFINWLKIQHAKNGNEKIGNGTAPGVSTLNPKAAAKRILNGEF